MNDLISSLKKTILLKALPEETIETCLATGTFSVKRYESNHIIHFVGDLCTHLELILAGKVVVDHMDEAGKLMTISEFDAGEILSGNLMFSSNPHYPMTITARQPSVILNIAGNQLIQLFLTHSGFLKAYLSFIADHTMILSNTIRYAVNQTIRERMVRFLNSEYQKQKTNPIQLKMSKKSIAERFGIQRTSLSRELAKMKQDGLIKYDAHQITLLWKQPLSMQNQEISGRQC